MSKVLIVDDDMMLADCLEEVLIDAGYEVCGIACTVAEAVELGIRHRPDLGVIDLRLRHSEFGTAVAAALCPVGGFGVLYATGNPEHPMLDEAMGDACITKPYSGGSIVTALQIVSARMNGQPPPGVTPPGFRLLNG